MKSRIPSPKHSGPRHAFAVVQGKARLPRKGLARASKRIERFIANYLATSGAKGLVLGLSGGLDSAVTLQLCVRAVGANRVLGLILPSESTPSSDVHDAASHADKLSVRHRTIDISPLAESYAKLLPRATPKIKGNLVARIRMNILYHHAALENYLVVGTSDKSEWNIGYFCYDDKTRALTKDGFKTYNQLKPGDTVFSLDLRTGEVRERPINSMHIFDYSGKMIHLNSRAVDLLVTPNHRMLVHMRKHDGNGVGRMRFRTIDECLNRKLTIFPVPKPWSGNTDNRPKTYHFEYHQNFKIKTVDIPINHLLYLFGLFIGDGCCYKGRATVPVKTMLNRSSYISTVQREANGRFAKLLVQEQASDYKKTYDTYEVIFALPEGAKDNARANLISILESCQIGFSTTKHTVRISSSEIYSLFSQCGTYAKNKKIPKWLLQYPADNLMWLYKGLKDSDGNHASKNDVYYTISPQLAADYIELCIKIGKLGTFRLRPGRESKISSQNKAIVSSPCFEISTTGYVQTRLFYNENAKRIPYEGKIWCPEIPETHNLLVERNGKIAFCGNSKYGDGGSDLMPLAGLYKTQVRALAEHLGIPEKIRQKKSSPRLWPGQLAEKELGMDYETIDPILHCLIDRRMKPRDAAKKLGMPLKVVNSVKSLVSASAHKRSPPPITPA